MAGEDFRDTAVVINEAGEFGLDHLLVERGAEPVTLLDGGCLCCRAKGSLAPTLEKLLRQSRDGVLPPFRRIVVETSGLSDPAALLEQLIPDASLRGALATKQSRAPCEAPGLLRFRPALRAGLGSQ
nr:GTP-binding protein [Rhodopseudomonas rhenobacensis]